jgi:hypothetical protein
LSGASATKKPGRHVVSGTHAPPLSYAVAGQALHTRSLRAVGALVSISPGPHWVTARHSAAFSAALKVCARQGEQARSLVAVALVLT